MARKVLLADDSVTAQNMGRRILVDAGYEVITVNNGASALKKVAESKPDLIVLDVYMPGYGGLEVCQRIRESQETARIPVLLTVGKLEPFKSDEARRVRADAFIVKPFEASELLTALTKLEDKIVPQPSGRRASGRSFADEEPGASKEFGDIESGWKNRLKIPPPHHPRSHETASAPASDSAAAKPSEQPPQAASATTQEAKPAEPAGNIPTKDEQFKPEPEASEFAIRAEESADDTLAAGVPEIVQARPEDAPQEQQKIHEDEVAAALASLAPSNGHPSEAAVEPEPMPATMAATAANQQFSGPRWIAQEVALTDDESALILEQEMHKAFAAFAAADAARMGLWPTESVRSEVESSQQTEFAVSASSNGSESQPEEPASSGSSSNHQESTPPLPDAVAAPETSQSASTGEEAAAYAAAASAGTSAGSTASQEPEIASQPSVIAVEVPTPGESAQDTDLAAAWASWKQVRDSASTPEFASQIADTAATGFKEIRQEEPAGKPEPEVAADPAEESGIASIVDSVLAELKPKLMEQIAKKMKK